MKKFLLLLAAVGMIFTACEPANGLDEDNNGNQTEQPGNSGSQGGDDNTGGEDNPDNPGGGDQGGEDNPDNPGNDQGGEDAVFIVTPTSCSVPASGGTISLTLKYDVEDDYLQCGWGDENGNEIDWIELIDVRSNTMYLTFNVAENTSSNKRIGYIVLYDAKNDKYQEVAVEQEGKQNEEEVVFFVTPTSCTVPASGGKVSLTLKYDVEEDYLECGWCDVTGNSIDWIELIDTRTNTMYLTFSVAENTSSKKRTGYIILYDAKNNKEQKVTVTQEGKQNVVFEVSPSAITMSADGGTQDITVNTNIDYNVGCSASWVSCTKTTTGVKVTVAKSTSSQERTAEIKFTNTSYNVSKVVKVTQSGAVSESKYVIKYTSSDGKIVTPYNTDAFGANITSNTYSNGQGTISFDSQVKTIGNSAFSHCGSLTSITIPDGTTLIGENSFYYCEALKNITIPNSITSIEDSAFYCCKHLANIAIPNSVTSIGDYAFCYCTSLTSIVIPNYVISIGEDAFSGCTSLTSVTIPNSVTSIGDEAFANCTGELIINNKKLVETNYDDSNYPERNWLGLAAFTKLTIGNNITKIGNRAFNSCDSLTNIYIPNSVTSIGESAFFCCYALTKITIPNSIISIGDSAFYACESLTNITIPDSVTSIGEYAFHSCKSLTNIIIGDGCTSIGRQALYGCVSLISTTIGRNVTSIGNHAFWGCTGELIINSKIIEKDYTSSSYPDTDYGWLMLSEFTKITIGNSVTRIGNYMFYGYGAMTDVTIGNSVTSIGSNAFQGCELLSNVTIGNKVSSIGNYAFFNCNVLTGVTIPDSVTSIGNWSFSECDAIRSVVIGNGAKLIGDNAFSSCKSLSNVIIGNNVTTIGDSAFYGSKIAKVTIPSNVTSIGGYAFSNCTSLAEVYCKPSTPPTIKSLVFYDNASTRKIFVPTASVAVYKSANNWSAYEEYIEPYNF